MKNDFFFILMLLMALPFCGLCGQIGGGNTYEFLNLPNSARITAMGGMQIAIVDEDPNMAAQNPSLYNASMHNQLGLGAVAFLAGVGYGDVSYAYQLDSMLTIGAGIHYVNYGEFLETNAAGQTTGNTFTGGEYAFQLGVARKVGMLSYGASLKAIQSTIESYGSFGLAADIGATFYNPEKEFTAALVFKNLGMQLTTYNEGGEREDLPFDVRLAFSKKLKYLPLRFSITAHHLHVWDIRYDDPALQNNNDLFGTDTIQPTYFADKLFRHIILGGEFYFGKAMRVRVGYNHLRRQELVLASRTGLVGFSFGVGIRIKRFYIDYGRANYHLASGANHLSLGINLNGPVFKKKSKEPASI